jgi:isopentenyl-diphosphate delta-isomerase
MAQPHARSKSPQPTPVARRDQVVLVDDQDRGIGTCPKLAAHLEGRLHRAISVFVTDPGQRLLLQRRAITKYHSGGLWSNTCCTHPGPGEPPEAAAHRRLREEMGFDCDLECSGSIIYRAELAGGLAEHEYDHLFVGRFEGTPNADPREVAGWRWAGLAELAAQRTANAEAYTPWFWIALEHLVRTGALGPDLAFPQSGPPGGTSPRD